MLTQCLLPTASLNWNPKAQLVGEPYLSCQLQAEEPEAASTLLTIPRFPPVVGEQISCEVKGLTQTITVIGPVMSNEVALAVLA